jgi:hypothetical protein
MRPLSSDLREFIHLLNTNRVKYVIVGAWALALEGPRRSQVYRHISCALRNNSCFDVERFELFALRRFK